MEEKPKALRLADRLSGHGGLTFVEMHAAAAELRCLVAQRDQLLEALRLTHIECQHLHHAKKDQHALGQPCPVAARINATIAQAEH